MSSGTAAVAATSPETMMFEGPKPVQAHAGAAVACSAWLRDFRQAICQIASGNSRG